MKVIWQLKGNVTDQLSNIRWPDGQKAAQAGDGDEKENEIVA